MKPKQTLLKLISLGIWLFFVNTGYSQTMNRTQMFNNIISNIYQNPNHAVTGQTLQNVLLNQNYSYNNLKTDTDFVSVFDTGYTYYKGMSVLSNGDSIYRCTSSSHHGPWKRADFIFANVPAGGAIPTGAIEGQALVFHNSANTWSYNLYDNTGANSLDWSNRLLSDNNGTTSEDYSNRILYDSHNQPTVNWQNSVLKAYSFSSGSTPVLFWQSQYLVDMNEYLSQDWGNRLWYDNSGQISGDYSNRFLYDNSQVLSQDWNNRWLYDESSTTSGDYSNRILYNSNSVATENWENGVLKAMIIDKSTYKSVPVLYWQNQWLLDIEEIISMDWNQRYLYDNNVTISEDYNNRFLNDVNGNISIDWGGYNTIERDLYDDYGNKVLSWEAGGYIGYDGSGTTSIDWGRRYLFDNSDATYLTYSNGTNPTVATDIISKGYADVNYGVSSQIQGMAFSSVSENSSCNTGFRVLYINATFAAASSVGTIALPSSPVEGQIVEYLSTTSNSATYSNFSPVPTVLTTTVPSSGTHLKFIYDASAASWYEIQ
ncbi:MAG TPA: hypothetical protein VK808_01110 [Bacteroidia bacterium]|nr:hypothetical protein [Bacteroidia bacterium]